MPLPDMSQLHTTPWPKATQSALRKPSLRALDKLQLIKCHQNDRLAIMAAVQAHTYKHLFKAKPKTFYTSRHHYDWWMFPMHVPKEWGWQARNYLCSITPGDGVKLLNNKKFFNVYIKSMHAYLKALKDNGWNDYPVRYARLLHSLALFLQVTREGVGYEDEYALLLKAAKYTLKYADETFAEKYPHYDLLRSGLHMIEHELGLATSQPATSRQFCSS